jgi:hypothetical protein
MISSPSVSACRPAQRQRAERVSRCSSAHEMHHRGQLMLLERLVGVVPHLTREGQARLAAMQAAKLSA